MPPLVKLLRSSKKTLRKEASWTVSNITAGTRVQIQQVIDSGCFPILIEILESAEEMDVKKEVAWAISNASVGGSPQQIDYMVRCHALRALSSLLNPTVEPIVLQVALEGIANILKSGKTLAQQQNCSNFYATLLEEAGGVDKIEALQNHSNSTVYEKSLEILEEYFEKLDED